MRKLTMMQHISLDGVIQIADRMGGSDFPYGDWTAPYRSPAGLARVTAMYGERFDLLLGRRTYDLWSTYWPQAPSSPMGDRLNAATKYVVTHRPEDLSWGPAEGVRPDLVEGVRRLKESGGVDLILAGSSTITSALLEGGLVDELVLLVSPVLLGTGKRLFAEGTPPRSFVLQSAEALPTGVVINILRYGGTLLNLR